MPGQIRPAGRIQPGGIEFDPPSNWVGITGMIPNSISQAYKWYLSEFQPIFTNISCLVEFQIRPVEFDRARNTAQIGSKSIEMIPNSISQSYECNLSEFQPILSSISCPVEFQIRPVKFDRARNTAQIGSKSIEMIPNSISQSYECNLSEFQPILSSISCPVKFEIRFPVEFDQARNTAQIGSKSIEMIPNSISQSYKCNLSEFTPIFTNISCLVEFNQA